MTFRQDDAETIALALNDAPRLADGPVPTYDDRLQDLMQGQQEVMNRVFGSGSLQDVLGEIVLVCERVFAPAQCVLSLFYRGGISVTHQAASPLPSRLLDTVGIARKTPRGRTRPSRYSRSGCRTTSPGDPRSGSAVKWVVDPTPADA